jgi:hypothetical protein
MSGVSFLTDPVFSDRASVMQAFGPFKRLVPVPFTLAELRKTIKIDFAILSHNHYDHLDAAVVTEMGDNVRWFVPVGMKRWFTSQNVNNVVEVERACVVSSQRSCLERALSSIGGRQQLAMRPMSRRVLRRLLTFPMESRARHQVGTLHQQQRQPHHHRARLPPYRPVRC